MSGRRTLPFLVAGLAALGASWALTGLPSSRAHAAPTTGDPAYYVVVQSDAAGAGQSSHSQVIVQTGQTSVTAVQVGDGRSAVECTRYASADDAQAAASARYVGQTWAVVLADDALHALMQNAGAPADMLALLPALSDADVCTP